MTIRKTNKPDPKMNQTQRKDWIQKKLERLIKMCKATEPEKPNDTELFTEDNIKAHKLHEQIDEGYEMMGASDIKDIMMEANRIWKIRRMVWNGDADNHIDAKMQSEIEDFLLKGHKINAIKHYRATKKIIGPAQPSLRESKEYVDAIQTIMISTGKLSI